jgi:hypothetical protein
MIILCGVFGGLGLIRLVQNIRKLGDSSLVEPNKYNSTDSFLMTVYYVRQKLIERWFSKQKHNSQKPKKDSSQQEYERIREEYVERIQDGEIVYREFDDEE